MTAAGRVTAPEGETPASRAIAALLALLSAGRSNWRKWLGPLALGLVLAGLSASLIYVNCVWACYPNDNDLDEVAWLSAHLSFSRPESFANQGYPPGLPVVLRLLTPLVGSFLRATFLWQSLAATASVFFVWRIAARLSPHPSAGALGLLCAALAGLPVFTSEFADGSSTALFLGGLWGLSRRGGDRRGFFLLGVASGFSYLFRTHYLMLTVLVPAAALVAGFGWRSLPKIALAFWAGFAATAWPLWLMNTLAYGTPVHAGVSQYNIAYVVVSNALDWENYPNTYARWPLSRVLREYPWELAQNSLNQVLRTFGHNLSLAGAAFGAFALVLTRERTQRQLLAFSGLLALFYVCLVIVPTRYTDRAYAPVAMVCSLLLGCGLSALVHQTQRPGWYLPWAVLSIALINYPQGMWDLLQGRARDARYNQRISNLLVANGMRSSDEVFSNYWNIYNLADPNFVSFYNYGGWIELDSLYAQERPHPTAITVPEWQAFFAEQGIRFAILRQRPKTAQVFRKPPDSWRKLFSDKTLTVWAIDPPPEAQHEAAQKAEAQTSVAVGE